MNANDFEMQFKRLYLPLGMFALRIVDDADHAEDLVEEAFAKTWTAVCDDAHFDNFKAYMYMAVRNECITFLRRRKETVSLDYVQDIDDESIDTSERDARIWKAIDDLPEKCREIFLLSKRDGLSNNEIAEELDISVKTVKNQMTKALKRLRDAISDGYKPFFLPFL